MDELEILKTLLPSLQCGPEVLVPPGDDCAAIRPSPGKVLLAAVDQLSEGVHYVDASASARAAGEKLLKRNLSDIAAMGGVPRWCMVALAAEKSRSNAWICEFLLGVAEAAKRYGVALVGGDLCAIRPGGAGVTASLSILGECEEERVCRRDRLRPGDGIYVTGRFGNSLRSGHHLNFEPRLKEGRFLSGRYTRCMMDVSDGLALDLRRMLLSSHAGAAVEEEAVPLRAGADVRAAWGDGEDYELLFGVPPDLEGELCAVWPEEFAELHRIGRATAENEGRICDLSGKEIPLEHYGYEHK